MITKFFCIWFNNFFIIGFISRAYINLIDQKEPTFDLADKNESKIALDDKRDYYKKIILPTEKELTDHSEFLKKNLKKNYF